MNSARQGYRAGMAITLLLLVGAAGAAGLGHVAVASALAALGLAGAVLVGHLRLRLLMAHLQSRDTALRGVVEASSERMLTKVAGDVRAVRDDLQQRVDGLTPTLLGAVAESSSQALTGIQGAEQRMLRAYGGEGARLADLVSLTRKTVFDQTKALRGVIEQLPSTADEYTRMRERLADESTVLPSLGGWAMTSAPLVSITDRISRAGAPMNIIELGSGGSSTWIGLALRHSAVGGHDWALDHLTEYADRTRAAVTANGLIDIITVVDAPLVPVEVDGTSFDWYDLSGLPDDLPAIDILLVDGPPGAGGPHARYPAFPLLRDRLRAGAWVYVDDTNRKEERDIVARWVAENPGLTVVDDFGKTTVLHWNPTA